MESSLQSNIYKRVDCPMHVINICCSGSGQWPASNGHHSSSSTGGGRDRVNGAPAPAGARPNLPEAMEMLNALPDSVKGCLLEAARLCGPAAIRAQENVINCWASQVNGTSSPGFLVRRH